MSIRFLSPLILTLLLAGAVSAEQYSGRVVGVSDGDTLSVMRAGKAEKVRLHGVDAPESAQPFGTRAKQATSEMVFGKDVTVRVKEKDQYGRTVGEVLLPDGRSLNSELVRTGMAWWYRQYARTDKQLERLQNEARTAGRGLWADKDPTPPWEFRRNKRQSGSAPSERTEPASRDAGISANRPAAASDVSTGTVHVTERGNRYHRATCRSIDGRGRPLSLSEARSRGIKPCGNCKP